MSGLDKKVLMCKECGSSKVKVTYGEDIRYPDDYVIECLNCLNWEEGNGAVGSFKVLDEPMHPNNKIAKWEEELRMNKKDTNSGNKDRFMIDIDKSTSIAISDMVTDCTKVMLGPFFNRIDPTIANANKLVSELKRALLSELDNYNKQRREEIWNTKVYLLQGADVVAILDELDREDLTEDIDKLEDIVAYVDRKLEIPWMEYVSTLVEAYIDEEGM